MAWPIGQIVGAITGLAGLTGGDGSKANKRALDMQQQLVDMAVKQYGIMEPLSQAYVQQQLQQAAAAQQYLPYMLGMMNARTAGAPLVQYSVPGLQATPGQAPAAMDTATGTHPSGGFATPFPGGSQGVPGPASGGSTPAPTTEPATPAPAATAPTYNIPAPGAMGDSADLYQQERRSVERLRTDLERQTTSMLGTLGQSLGARFGSSGAAAGALAGATSETISRANEAGMNARLALADQQRAIEDQRAAEAYQIMGSLMGLNVAPALGAMGQAQAGIGQAANLFQQMAAQAQQRNFANQKNLANVGYAIGAGAFQNQPQLQQQAAAPVVAAGPVPTASGLGLAAPSPLWGNYQYIPWGG